MRLFAYDLFFRHGHEEKLCPTMYHRLTGMFHFEFGLWVFGEMVSPGLKQPWAETVLGRRRVELD